MGKSLIIPGADFSANAIDKSVHIEEWYLDDSVFTDENITWHSYLVSSDAYTLARYIEPLYNKTVNAVKVRKNPNAEDVYLILYLVQDGRPTAIEGDIANIITTREIPITIEDVGIYKFEPITIGSNQTLYYNSTSSNIERGRGAMRYTGENPYGVERLSYRFTLPSNKFSSDSNSHSYYEINFGFISD